jgi:hypothetical protein
MKRLKYVAILLAIAVCTACQTVAPPESLGMITGIGFGHTEELARRDAWNNASEKLLKTGMFDVYLVQTRGFEPRKGPNGYEYLMEFDIRRKKK